MMVCWLGLVAYWQLLPTILLLLASCWLLGYILQLVGSYGGSRAADSLIVDFDLWIF